MPNLFAMSFEGTLAPSFDLRCLHVDRTPPDGWGIGYYPGGEPSASVLKEPAPDSGSIRSELVKAWDHLASSIFIVHVRTATWGQNSDANTQPFSRAHGGRDWLIGHSGSLRERLVVNGRFEPVGSTDTELVFCDLLDRFAEAGWRSIGECDLARLRLELGDLNEHGTLSLAMSDGQDLLIYSDAREAGLYLSHLLPPHGKSLAFGDEDLIVDLTSRGEVSRKGVVISSSPLARADGRPMEWTHVPPGHLLVVRQGAIIAELAAEGRAAGATLSVRKLRSVQTAPRAAEPKTLQVVHRTIYRYDQRVERSSHLLKLVPVDDRVQRLLEHSLVLTLDGEPYKGSHIDFDDVFGNRTRRVVIERPYRELVLEARSRVRIEAPPLDFKPLDERRVIPLVWMPWQREMMAPYLLPAELPETQLHELADYARAFVVRNDNDLIGTLLDMNRSIFKEYKYLQGSTTLGTTAFDVYAHRRGVCQDFTNLFICMARLLSIPARYTCGYLCTGPKAENTAQSEASHAWVELYLPEHGWQGFDPTNGVVTQTDHVRVAVGRSYQDATPTSGTLYVGGGLETLVAEVRVEVI